MSDVCIHMLPLFRLVVNVAAVSLLLQLLRLRRLSAAAEMVFQSVASVPCAVAGWSATVRNRHRKQNTLPCSPMGKNSLTLLRT